MTNLITHIGLLVSWTAYILSECLGGENNITAAVLRIITGALVGYCLGNAIVEVVYK